MDTLQKRADCAGKILEPQAIICTSTTNAYRVAIRPGTLDTAQLLRDTCMRVIGWSDFVRKTESPT